MKYTAVYISLSILLSCSGKKPETTELRGKPMPSFSLLLQDSTTYINTGNIPMGQPVVLFYFGPHCPYSRAQIEAIIDDIAALKKIRIYAFTTWPFSELKEFYRHYQLNKYSNIIVGVDYTNFFGKYFRAQGVPYMAIYGKNRRLNEAFIGKIDADQIRKVSEE